MLPSPLRNKYAVYQTFVFGGAIPDEKLSRYAPSVPLRKNSDLEWAGTEGHRFRVFRLFGRTGRHNIILYR